MSKTLDIIPKKGIILDVIPVLYLDVILRRSFIAPTSFDGFDILDVFAKFVLYFRFSEVF